MNKLYEQTRTEWEVLRLCLTNSTGKRDMDNYITYVTKKYFFLLKTKSFTIWNNILRISKVFRNKNSDNHRNTSSRQSVITANFVDEVMKSDFRKVDRNGGREYADSLERLPLNMQAQHRCLSQCVGDTNTLSKDGQLPFQYDFWDTKATFKQKCLPKSEFQFLNLCKVLLCLEGKSYLPANALPYFCFPGSLIPVTLQS